MFNKIYIIISLVMFSYTSVFASVKNKEILLYKESIPLMMEVVFEFANDELKEEVLTLFDKLTKNKYTDPRDSQRFTHLLRTFLQGISNKDKSILDRKLTDKNLDNNNEIKEIIIPKLKKFKKLLSDKDLKIKNIKKYEKWSNKIKKQIFLVNYILDMLTISNDDKDKIRKLLKEIEILIENKKFVL